MQNPLELGSVEQTLERASLLSLMNDRRRKAATVFNERLVVGYAGGLFRADSYTIATAKTLMEITNPLIMIDMNDNPIKIEDGADFMQELTGVLAEASADYHQAIEEINALRTKEGLTNV